MTGETQTFISQKLLDFFLPPLCLSCHNAGVLTPHSLCPRCWGKLNFLTTPCCHQCGWPFPFAVGEALRCSECLRHPPAFSKARSVLIYDQASKPLILRFKHSGALELIPLLVLWLETIGRKEELFTEITAIIPVPLHWWRLFQRGYNQAGLLAKGLAHKLQVPWHSRWLRRRHYTPSQGGLNKKERRQNVKGAFYVPQPHKPALQGQKVLLLDDVFTTGATLRECSQVLLKAGAKEVRVLTVGRTVRSFGNP